MDGDRECVGGGGEGGITRVLMPAYIPQAHARKTCLDCW